MSCIRASAGSPSRSTLMIFDGASWPTNRTMSRIVAEAGGRSGRGAAAACGRPRVRAFTAAVHSVITDGARGVGPRCTSSQDARCIYKRTPVLDPARFGPHFPSAFPSPFPLCGCLRWSGAALRRSAASAFIFGSSPPFAAACTSELTAALIAAAIFGSACGGASRGRAQRALRASTFIFAARSPRLARHQARRRHRRRPPVLPRSSLARVERGDLAGSSTARAF